MKDTTNLSGHKTKSEICKKNGAYKPEIKAFSNDIEKELKKVITRHKGKLSTDAMLLVIMHNANFITCFAKAMST